jgi:hypothetical protein
MFGSRGRKTGYRREERIVVMKKALVAAVVLVAGLVAYNYATTGEIKVVPTFSLSEEEQELKDLGDRFKAARRQFAQAHRAAAVGGVDTTADVEAARRAVGEIDADLTALKERTTSDKVRRDADELDALVSEFKSELR